MDLSTCYCGHRRCSGYGQTGSQAQLQLAGWHRRARQLKCLACGHGVSARTGTAYAGSRTSVPTFRPGVRQLAEGTSIRAVARNIECDKDTVRLWLPRVGRHSRRLPDYFFRHLHLTECQLEELWTFVYKKEKHLTRLEKLAEVYGDAWVWIAFDPVHKLVPTWRVGKRTFGDATQFVKSLKSKHDSHRPFFIRTCPDDDLPQDADVLLDIYGETYTPPGQGTRGWLPLPRKRPPPDLCYGVVVKEREGHRLIRSTTRLVYGTEAQLLAFLHASPVSATINTYGVERNRLRRDGSAAVAPLGAQEPALSAVEG